MGPITFARLRRADFPLLVRWLSDPVVARWWAHETSLAAVERDFGAAVDGTEQTQIFLACAGGRPIGLIQRYRIADEPDYGAELSALCPVPPGAMSIDYLIGEADCRGRGLGTAMIAEFVAAIWSDHPEATAVVVAVHADNAVSWRTLQRVGFGRVAAGELAPDNPVDSREHYVYRLDRRRSPLDAASASA